MIVSIHQPQYLPWLSYMLKIAESEIFIILDSVDFQKNGLQNRNQIKTDQGASWLTVPVRQNLGQKIMDVEINNSIDWRKKHWSGIVQNYGKAPLFRIFADELEGVYAQDWRMLVDLNLQMIEMMLRWMNIPARMLRSSQMKAEGKASDLVLSLCREVGARRYISGTGGKNYLDEAAFQDAGVEIVYRPPSLPEPYPQQHPKAGFLNDLSVLDIILNCGEGWRAFLKSAAQV
jgi:hypothetical protein